MRGQRLAVPLRHSVDVVTQQPRVLAGKTSRWIKTSFEISGNDQMIAWESTKSQAYIGREEWLFSQGNPELKL